VTPTAWRGVAVLILATGLAATIVLLAVETILHSGAISTQEASLLSTTLGATVGALAVYLGGHAGPPDNTGGHGAPPDEPG
jgi:hypothetical protein